MRIQKYLIALIILTVSVNFIGCGSSQTSPRIARPPAYSITINQLASKLGLRVQSGGAPYYELANAHNRVLLFTYKHGRVYVNGNAVCQVGKTTEVKGTTYVSGLLAPKILSHLVTSSTPPTALPDAKGSQYATGTVVIDAGHGGKDPGATSYHGYYEKTINLSIARKVRSYLEDRGVQVIMTRNSDTFIELNERAEIANRAGADLFVSVHGDSHPSPSQNGYTIYVARSASWTSKKVGIAIEQAMGQTGLSSVGIRNQDFRVLVRTKCPAVLVECGYLTNPSESSLLNDGDFQDTVAHSIAEGVITAL